MKKLLAVLLTIGILFTSVLAVNSFAAGSTESGIVATPSDPTVPAVPEKLLAPEWSDMIWDTRQFSADQVITNADGVKGTGAVYAKGTNVRMDMTISSITLSTLTTDDKTYIYFTKFPFFHISMKNTYSPLSAYNFPASDLIETYYEDGYQVEKYNYNNEQIYTYYFDNGELHSIEALNETTGEYVEFTNFSYDVKAKDVMLPPTAIFDVTFLFSFVLYYFS